MKVGVARMAVLGLVLEQPGYPYELSVRFDERVGQAWGMHRAQIYQTVHHLEEEGLVERTPQAPTRRAAVSDVFRATDRGREAFEAWLRDGDEIEPRPARDALFVKLAFSRPDHAADLLELVAGRENAALDRLGHYARMCADDDRSDRHSWHDVASELILDGTVGALQAQVKWLRRVRAKLEEHAARLPCEAQARDTDAGSLAHEGGNANPRLERDATSRPADRLPAERSASPSARTTPPAARGAA
jgi:DNA-binding PadR family transcriptional regulator